MTKRRIINYIILGAITIPLARIFYFMATFNIGQGPQYTEASSVLYYVPSLSLLAYPFVRVLSKRRLVQVLSAAIITGLLLTTLFSFTVGRVHSRAVKVDPEFITSNGAMRYDGDQPTYHLDTTIKAYGLLFTTRQVTTQAEGGATSSTFFIGRFIAASLVFSVAAFVLLASITVARSKTRLV